jgi:hypothetical protein
MIKFFAWAPINIVLFTGAVYLWRDKNGFFDVIIANISRRRIGTEVDPYVSKSAGQSQDPGDPG